MKIERPSVHAKTSVENQDWLVRWCVIASVLFHVALISIAQFGWFKSTKPIMLDEWSISAELVADFDHGASNKTVIPDAEEADEVLVPSNLLPQVPTRFETKEQEKQELGMEEPSVDEEKLEEGKNLTEDTTKEEVTTEPDPEITTRLDEAEALRRAALDRLRQEQTERSRELKAHKDDKLARIRDALQDGAGLDKNVGGGLMASAESRRYQRYLTRTIRRNYALPNTYKFQTGYNDVVLRMRISDRGELLAVDIQESSGDQVLDSYCIEAVKRSAPFDPPPTAIAGRDIGLNFKP